MKALLLVLTMNFPSQRTVPTIPEVAHQYSRNLRRIFHREVVKFDGPYARPLQASVTVQEEPKLILLSF